MRVTPVIIICYVKDTFSYVFVCRDKSNTPSGFTLKLRKHIRTRRLEDVRQIGYDRVYTFSEYLVAA